jgi:hypothetical protein
VTRLPTVPTVLPTVLLMLRTAVAAATELVTSTLPVPLGVAMPATTGICSNQRCSRASPAVGRSLGLYDTSCGVYRQGSNVSKPHSGLTSLQ